MAATDCMALIEAMQAPSPPKARTKMHRSHGGRTGDGEAPVSRRAGKRQLIAWTALAVLSAFVPERLAAQESRFPFPANEELAYSIAWPSGLTVGTAEFRARRSDPGWRFEMKIRASVPKIEIDDAFVSRTDELLCSLNFEKHIRHGTKRAHEILRFGEGALYRTNLEARGRAVPGTAPIAECARDALATIYSLRRDLAAGRIPPPEEIYFGAAYRLQLEYRQTRGLAWGSDRHLADEIRIEVRGPASHHAFSAFFGQDAARTPLLFVVEFEDGPFTMKLLE